MNKKQQILRKLGKNVHAVSPVIATLMLVLVAVGSAGAYYMWQSGWQSDVEGKAEGADIKASLSIAGSTTVYPFTAVATTLFEAEHENYKIAYQSGGSGAGVHAAAIGAVDIGSSSSRLTADQKSKYPDLDENGVKDLGKDLVETLVAYDAIVFVISDTNTHGLVSIDGDTVKEIYSANGGLAGTYNLDFDGSGYIEWNEVPLIANTPTPYSESDMYSDLDGDGTDADPCDGDIGHLVAEDDTVVGDYFTFIDGNGNGDYNTGETIVNPDVDRDGTDSLSQTDGYPGYKIGNDAGELYLALDADDDDRYDAGEMYDADFDNSWSAGDATPVDGDGLGLVAYDCGSGDEYLFLDTRPSNEVYDLRDSSDFCTGSEVVTIYDRAEVSGTEETFISMMKYTVSKYTLEENGVDTTHNSHGEHCAGNEIMLQKQAADADCLGFMSYGYAKATGSGVTMIPYAGIKKVTTLIDPSDSGFKSGVKKDVRDYYDGARELLYITVGEPKGEAKVYVDFCRAPRMNMDICGIAGYISMY